MSIKGVSEIIRLPRRGKIRLGVKAESEVGNCLPVPTDHFVCPDEAKRIFGEKPKELRIMFPTENPSQWASQYLRCYSSTRELVCRGDGEAALARIDKKTGQIATTGTSHTELREIVCDRATCFLYQCGRCRRVMNLQFLLPDCPGYGVYQLDTSSSNSIININSGLEYIRGVYGRVSMIPLCLKLVEHTFLRNGHSVRVYVLELSAPYTAAEMHRCAQVPPGQTVLVPPPDSEAPDDLFPDGLPQDGIDEDKPQPDEELVALWDKAKRKIWRFDIQDSQLAGWFDKFHRIAAGLKDFDEPLPPARYTKESLKDFCRAVERYASG